MLPFQCVWNVQWYLDLPCHLQHLVSVQAEITRQVPQVFSDQWLWWVSIRWAQIIILVLFYLHLLHWSNMPLSCYKAILYVWEIVLWAYYFGFIYSHLIISISLDGLDIIFWHCDKFRSNCFLINGVLPFECR